MSDRSDLRHKDTSELVDEIIELRKQRDELLAASKQLIRAIYSDYTMHESLILGRATVEGDNAVLNMTKVIARVQADL